MSWLLDGLPLHPLFVHAAVVAIPVMALLGILTAWVAQVRDGLGILFPVLTTATFVATLLTTASGEALAEQIAQTPAVTAHTGIADLATAGAFLLLLVSWAQWGWHHAVVGGRPGRFQARVARPGTARRVATGIAVAQTLTAIFAIVAVVIVGDTGARAVWLG